MKLSRKRKGRNIYFYFPHCRKRESSNFSNHYIPNGIQPSQRVAGKISCDSWPVPITFSHALARKMYCLISSLHCLVFFPPPQAHSFKDRYRVTIPVLRISLVVNSLYRDKIHFVKTTCDLFVKCL